MGTEDSLRLSAVDELPSREDRLASALGSLDNTFGDLQPKDPSPGYPNIEVNIDEDPISIQESEIVPKRKPRLFDDSTSAYYDEPGNLMAL